MDGSCNGLQHYAALGLDEVGGRAVNLSPSPDGLPADVYMGVCNLVNQQVCFSSKILLFGTDFKLVRKRRKGRG
jgi:DNA-directed RNA polymerase, mitochondrial